MKMSNATIFCVIVIFYMAHCVVQGGVISERDPRAIRQQLSAEKMMPKKRPFCNAFTGCGRKRSSLPIDITSPLAAPAGGTLPSRSSLLLSSQNNNEDTDFNYNEDNLAQLLDLNQEPAVEDLMRQIMSEAKLWEAIQEATRAIYLQKNGHQQPNQYPVAFSSQ